MVSMADFILNLPRIRGDMIKTQVYRETLKEIYESHGVLDPKDVVETAKKPACPIHEYFEWDDSKAGDEYRLWQARQLITRIWVEDKPVTQEYHNVIVSVDDEPVRGYVPITRVLSEQDLYNQVLSNAIDEIDYWTKKYQSLKEAAKIINHKELEKARATVS